MSNSVKKQKLPLYQLLPNLVTIVAISAGLSAIRFAFQGNYILAVQLILLACVLDGVDGRIARMMKSESALGAELDSLADFLNFGVAPALMVYIWAFQDMRNEGWIAVVVYVVCCVMRLARFNIGNKSETLDGPKNFFVGVPSPAGAFLLMLPMFYSFIWSDSPALPAWLIGLYMIAIGLLMIGRIPTWSIKSVSVMRSHVKFLLVGFGILFGALFSYPWETLLALGLAYLLGILFAWRSNRAT